MSTPTRKYYLNAMRCFSVLAVFIYHFVVAMRIYPRPRIRTRLPFFHYMTLGQMGVFLFLMISGCGLWLGYRDKLELKVFFKKRFLRIFPIFYVCYIPSYIFLAIMNRTPLWGGNPLTLLLTLVGLDGYLSGVIPNYYILGEWFLGAIVLIYLLFPLLRVVFLSKARWPFTIFMFVMLGAHLYFNFPCLPGRMPFFIYVLAFWCGMLMIEYEEFIQKTPFLLVSATVALISFSATFRYHFNVGVLLILTLSIYPIFVLFFTRVNNMVINFFSKYSFAMILTHHVLMNFYFQNFKKLPWYPPVFVAFILLFAITVGTAYAASKICDSIMKKLRP